MIIKHTKNFIKEYPTHTVLLSLILTIIAGAAMLALPICRHSAINIIDLIFVSTSLITVTGLTPVPFETFTTTGQAIMLILMQLGGIGLMTMSLFIMSLFVNLGLYTQVLASEILSIQSFKDTQRILFFIIKLTLACELIGAFFTFFVIRHDYTLSRAIFLSIFHAVNCFCNVGISLFPQNSLAYNTNIVMLLTTTFLILFGSLGFVTWHEFLKLWRFRNHTNHHHKISWHTYLVLKTFFVTGGIIAVLFWILEHNNTLQNMNWWQKLLNILLLGISTKSSGYLSVAISFVQPATLLLLIIAAFIGSAPSSTGGGIKTSAFAIFFAVIRATIKGRHHAEIHGRRIAKEQVYKAMAIIALACSWIVFTTFCLLITEQNKDFFPILFETVSAFANNGMSLGITQNISVIGKIFLILTMIIGRIGALTLILGMQRSSDVAEFSYPEERVILG